MRSPRLHNHTPAPAGLRRWLTGLVLLLATLGSRAQAPDHTPAYYVERIENYVQVNAWQEAKRVIDEGLNEYSDDPNLRYYNGRYFYVAGRLNDARYNLTRAIQTDEMHFRAKRLLVDVEDGLKHYSSAICYLNELLEFQPYDRDMWRRKIALYRKIGNQVEADNALQRLAHIYPNDTIVARELRNHHRETWSDVLLRGTNAEAAINLEQWIDKDPENLEYYVELTNVYERMGEYDHALGTANRGLVHFPGNAVLINKIIGLMTARGLYHQALAFARQHNVSHLYNDLLGEIASQARMNDPYEANGRLYAATHDRDALNYLINTSLTRGYYDDARVYLGDAMKRDGRTAALLMKLYTLEQKSGNEQAAIKVLEELYQRQPDDEELIEQYAALMLRLGSSEMEGEQWHDARQHLARALELMTPEQETWPATVSRQITVLGHLGLLDEARRLYRDAAAQASPENARRFASAYEDIVANRLRLLVEEQNYETALRQAQALLEAVPGSDVALRCCINMSQTLRRDRLFWDYALQGYDTHPDDPYFIVKHALALQQQKRNAEALELLRPHLVAGDWTNPQLTTAHSGLADEWANELIKNHMPDLALTVLDSALVHDPNNKELLYTKGVAYEHLKEFAKAFELQNRNYEPSNAEQQEWYEHMRYLRFRGFKNRIDASYTTAYYDTKNDNIGSIAHLYSIASIAYSRLWRHDTFTGQVSYKGIDGYHIESTETDGDETAVISDDESGGVGLEFMGQWEHTFNHHWSGMANLAWSTRYFNKFGANLSASYAARHGWTPTLKVGYRRTPETYLYLAAGQALLTQQEKLNLFIITPSVEKAWERIKLNGSLDLTAMQSGLYYNVGVKGKFFINEDNISSVSLLAGFGSFPELSFFDQTALQGVSHTNAMVGFDAQYLLTRNLYIGLAGSWNTCYDPYRLANGTLANHYRNIFSITAQLHVAF
ncbi:MAG: hypothetical protein IJT19_03895 [Bacteroidaceae bacterium]|nr:hypothetical protein [Bacteroidaceae bacterium]